MNVQIPAWLALLAGILPDYDIYFRPVLAHHTWTHSLLVLVPVTLMLTVQYDRLGLAVGLGMLSHLLTDSLVGTIPVFYPFSVTIQIGLNLGIPSVADTALESGALLVVLLMAFENKDYLLVLTRDRRSLWFIVPLYSLVTLSILFAGDNNISLSVFAFSRKALTLISVDHILLGSILLLGTLQGVRAVLSHSPWREGVRAKKRDTPRTEAEEESFPDIPD